MFNFTTYKKIDNKKNYIIKLSGEDYKEDRIFKGLHQLLEITNVHGKFMMETFTFPPNLSAKDIVTIEKYSFKVNKDFIEYNINGIFSSWMEIELNSITKEEFTNDLIFHIQSNYEPRYIKFSDNKLKMELKLGNFSLEDFMNYKKFKNPQNLNLMKIDEEKDNLNKLNKLNINTNTRKFKDEFGNEDNQKKDKKVEFILDNYNDNYNYDNRKTNLNSNLRKNIKKSKNFFDFSAENFLDFQEEKNFESTFNKENMQCAYTIPELNYNDLKVIKKSQYMFGLRPNFNQFGEFITLGHFDRSKKTFNLKLNKIVPNKNLVNDNNKTNKIDLRLDENLYDSYPRSLYKQINKNEFNGNSESFENRNKMKNENIFKESNIINHDYFAQTVQDFCMILNKNKNKYQNQNQNQGNERDKDKNRDNHLDKDKAKKTNFEIIAFNDNLKFNGQKKEKGEDSAYSINLDDFRDKDKDLHIKDNNIDMNIQKNLIDKDLKNYIERKSLQKNLNVIDYTNFLWEYISQLEKIKDKFINYHKINAFSDSEILTNLNKEISSLKLFIYLYLNPSNPQINNNTEKKKELLNTFSNSNSLTTQRLRKKKLIDWLINEDYTSKIADNEISKFSRKIFKGQINMETKESRNQIYKIIFFLLKNGRINLAMEFTSQFKLFNISLLIAQISSPIKDNKNIKMFRKEFFELVKEEQDMYLNFIYELMFPIKKNINSFFQQNSQNSKQKQNPNFNPNFNFKNDNYNDNEVSFAYKFANEFLNLSKEQIKKMQLDSNSNKFYIGNFYPSINKNNIINNIDIDNFYKLLNKFELSFSPYLLSELNWRQFLLCVGLYTQNSTSRIDDIIEEYSSMNIIFDNFNLPNLKSKINNQNNLNIQILQYYTFINNRKDININQINDLFNNKNIFSKFSDYHLHFIINFILIKNLEESYSHLKVHLEYLKKSHFFLLKKIVEDLLITGFISQAINLVILSNLNNSHKCKIIEEIIQRFTSIEDFNIEDIKLPLPKLFEKISPKITYDALALRYMSYFDIERTIEYLKYSENYEKLQEVKILIIYFLLFFIIYYFN
jgi:hypothetical protein